MNTTEHLIRDDRSAVVRIEGLSKRFGSRVAVDGVDLVVPRASAFGFLGPNGAGKTTLIRLLLGLTQPTGGEMHLLGLPVPERRAEALSRVGAIVEEPRFHPHLTGRENLRAHAAARGPDAKLRIPGALERVGLASRADDRVRTYSLGMRQRLGVARCLLADPELLILDEPMNGLDPAGIMEFRDLIRSFVDEGRTVFLSSHLLDEVEKTCDHVAIIDRGRILLQGSLAEVGGTAPGSAVIGSDDPSRAAYLLADVPQVARTSIEDGELVVALADSRDPDATLAEINRRLVSSGLRVHRIGLQHVSLEDRFLEMTSRMEVPA
ncbi:MAG TPA: ABC transporter ATP-binding protein [Actinomycetota bacterium]|jgi:ABC-2 type transport system ATP-binding protein